MSSSAYCTWPVLTMAPCPELQLGLWAGTGWGCALGPPTPLLYCMTDPWTERQAGYFSVGEEGTPQTRSHFPR